MIASIVLAPAPFSTFSLIIAGIVKTRERFMGIGQFLTMPISIVGGALVLIVLATKMYPRLTQ